MLLLVVEYHFFIPSFGLKTYYYNLECQNEKKIYFFVIILNVYSAQMKYTFACKMFASVVTKVETAIALMENKRNKTK